MPGGLTQARGRHVLASLYFVPLYEVVERQRIVPLSGVTHLVISELGCSRGLAFQRAVNPAPQAPSRGGCSPLCLILSGQSVFDVLDGERCAQLGLGPIPYEMIRGVFFLNRLAYISFPPPMCTGRCFPFGFSFHRSGVLR